ncbi:MAG: Agmatine deiminase [Parcubacteria group bacterium GW2011_GWA2_40_37]|nr:MAG: Agmatine deiminase [Parcubacteria group bacterium GW2011_GWA2_40_37]
MPAEWEKHEAVWLAWPHDKISFPPTRLTRVEERYVEIIKALSESELVNLLVLNEKMRTRVSEMLKKRGLDISKIIFHITDYADVWLRDYGPMFVLHCEEKKLSWIKWQYDAYAKKFPMLLKDNQVFYNLKNKIKASMLESNMILEGGSIEQNGSGTLLTTEQCLLNSSRNPSLSKKQIEGNLKNFLGATNIIWLKQGLENDHTDGHVDDIARFVSPDIIFCAYEEDENKKNHHILKKNFEVLEKALDQNSTPFKLVKLQVPHLVYDDNKPFEAGSIAPASYTNFYIGNTIVLVPTYNDRNDENALKIIQSYFANRKVIGIDCRDLIYGGGAIHCITQQQPAFY